MLPGWFPEITFRGMSVSLTRESAQGKSFDRLLVNGAPAAIVAPVQAETANLLVAYYGDQWKWWALVGGVAGLAWLVRNTYRPQDFPLMLEPSDQPHLLKSSWDTPAPMKPRLRTRGRKARLNE